MQDNLPANQESVVDPLPEQAPTVNPTPPPQTPTPGVSPVNPAPTPAPTNKILWVAVAILVIAAVAGLGYYLVTNKVLGPKVSPTPTPELTTPSPSPTEGWKLYQGETVYSTDGSTEFSIEYPPTWVLGKTTLYPFGMPKANEVVTKVLLGAGGHGWTGKIEKKTYPAGEASYSWIDNGKVIAAFASFVKNNNTYIIEIQNLASDKGPTFQTTFDNMLSTFQFVATPSASPTASASSTPTSSPTATPGY